MSLSAGVDEVIDVQAFARMRRLIPAERGNCYAAALRVAAMLSGEGAVVAHGEATLGGGPRKGERYSHAWVEVTMLGRRLVVDFSSDLCVIIDRRVYYRGGEISGADVHRYEPAEAERMMHAAGHCGPWHAGALPWYGDDGEPGDEVPVPRG